MVLIMKKIFIYSLIFVFFILIGISLQYIANMGNDLVLKSIERKKTEWYIIDTNGDKWTFSDDSKKPIIKHYKMDNW
jgi:hypothetical protein